MNLQQIKVGIADKLRYFTLAVLEIHVGSFDFAKEHGIGITVLDVYLTLARDHYGKITLRIGHHWFSGGVWSITLRKAP